MRFRRKLRTDDPGPPTTTRKNRAEWFYERATFPLRDAAPEALEAAWKNQGGEMSVYSSPIEWEQLGPFNIAGRTTCLAVQPGRDFDVFIAGSAGGGVWKRRSDEESWNPIWPVHQNHNIGALAIHPRYPDSLIVATGEANLSPDSYPGSGLYISNDGGMSWRPFPDDGSQQDAARRGIPRRVGAIAFDPFDKIGGAIGSVSMDERLVSGLYLIRGDYEIAPCAFFGNRSYNCHSVLFHPGRPGWIYAGLDLRGAANGIWRSRDSGDSWEQLTDHLPSGDKFGRTSMAFAPSNPKMIYAVAADRKRQLLGVFRSRDAGDSWEQIADPNCEIFRSERFLSYNNTITVHPDDENFVIWGGALLYRRRSDRDSWHTITCLEPYREPPQKRVPNPRYAHEDHHALLMPRGDLVYSGNDGGVALSWDAGNTWTDWSRGLVTTMFYDVDVAPSNGRVFGGGAQDNGTLIAGVALPSGEQLPPGDFIQGFPGDGGWLLFDPEDERKAFGSFQNFNILRHQHPMPWDLWVKASPADHDMSDAERNQRAIAVLELEPGNTAGRPRKLWAGSNRLWWTEDNGLTWSTMPAPFDGSAISAIHVATADPRIMFVGTSKGGVFRSFDQGESWSEDIGGPEIPRRLVTRLETHPNDARKVVATVASTGVAGAQLTDEGLNVQAGRPAFQKRYSNVFFSKDAGDRWEDIDRGALPNVVFHAVAFDTSRPELIYAAGDAGVFAGLNGDWRSLTANLPNVVVSDLVFHDKDRTLTAATYGRGIWRLDTTKLDFPEHPS